MMRRYFGGSKGAGSGVAVFNGVGIGMSGCTVRHYTISPVSEDTLTSRRVFLLTNGKSGPADLLRGAEKTESDPEQ